MIEVAILGTEGAGKTVLLNCLLRHLSTNQKGLSVLPADAASKIACDRLWAGLQEALWPETTDCSVSLNWEFRAEGATLEVARFVDVPGSAFRGWGTGGSQGLSKQSAIAHSVDYECRIALIVINPADFLSEREAVRKAESEMAIATAFKKLRSRVPTVPVAVIVAQSDLFPQHVSRDSPIDFIREHLPIVASLLTGEHGQSTAPTFSVSAINRTRVTVSDEGNARRIPAPGHGSNGLIELSDWLLDALLVREAWHKRPENAGLFWGGVIATGVLFFCIVVSGFSRPRPEIVSSRGAFTGVVWRDIVVEGTVKNNGSSGTVTIYAIVIAPPRQWAKNVDVEVPSRGTADFRILFSEYESGNASYQVSTGDKDLKNPTMMNPVR